jgi:hypothetical protein
MNSEREFHIDLCVVALMHLHNSKSQHIVPIHMDFEKLTSWYNNIDDDTKNSLFSDISKLKVCMGYENFYENVVYGYSVGK